MEENKNDKKKVMFFITKGNFGGAQRYVYDLATNLPKDRFEAVVACGTREGSSLVEKLSEKNIRTISLESSEREINFIKDFKTVRDLVHTIKAERPHVIHMNSSKIGFLGSLAVLYLRILNLFRISNLEFRALFTSHGWAFNERNRSALSKFIFYLAHYLTVFICDKTIAVSEKTKKDICFLPFIGKKILVIYNGVSSFKTLTKKEAAEILRKEKTDTLIYTIAELHDNKGVDVALKGISSLPIDIKNRVVYYIAGDGEEKERLQILATSLGLGNQVHFLGFVPEAKKLLSGADIFLFPSRTENLPFAILEAGLAGLPIVSTSVGGIPEIIKDMQNGVLVHSRNPKEIAEGIIYLLDHKDKQKEFGAEIKKTITNFFGLEKMLSETISVYSNS